MVGVDGGGDRGGLVVVGTGEWRERKGAAKIGWYSVVDLEGGRRKGEVEDEARGGEVENKSGYTCGRRERRKQEEGVGISIESL